MLLLRIIGILVAITVGSSIVAWLFTRDRRYLVLAGRVTKGALFVTLILLVLMVAERLVIP